MLEYWRDDPQTEVILLYLESFGNPRRFVRMARNISPLKPIVAVKSGRTPAGTRAAASHTGALATTELASEALFTQAGIIRVDTLEELFDIANLLSHQPIPNGNRVAILTNGGGPGILTADACAARGLELPRLSERTLDGLKDLLPERASFANPIDMTAEASADQYARALQLLLDDARIDMVIVIFIPPIIIEPQAIASAIREVAPEYYRRGKTFVASIMGWRSANRELSSGERPVPCFSFPESTAVALSRAYEYGQWLKRPKGVIPEFSDVKKVEVKGLIRSALKESERQAVWLDTDSIVKVLQCYGINVAQSPSAHSGEEAAELAEKLGFPVVVKLLSDTITHKTEVGGVALDLRTRADVEDAFEHIHNRLVEDGREAEMKGVTVQHMVEEGVEVIVGVTQSPNLGPLMLFGLGGIYAELFKDVVFRIHPLTDTDAEEMVKSVNAYKLLEGWRGAKPCDVASLEKLLLRVSALIEDLPEIAELDLNPVKVLEQGSGYRVVDARIRLMKPVGED
jgi:acetyltransferase